MVDGVKSEQINKSSMEKKMFGIEENEQYSFHQINNGYWTGTTILKQRQSLSSLDLGVQRGAGKSMENHLRSKGCNKRF
jgi:hypothetical protein